MTSQVTTDLLACLDAWGAGAPDRVLIRDFDVERNHCRGELTGGDIRELVASLGVGLRRLGIRAGDIVAVQLPNWREYLVTHLALYLIGAVTLPVSPIYRIRDVRTQLELSDARALVVPNQFKRRNYRLEALPLLDAVPTLQSLIVVGEDTSPESPPVHRWTDVLLAGSDTAFTDDRLAVAGGKYLQGDDALMLLNFTSGTTGPPKGVMHSHSSLTAGLPAIARRLQLDASDAILVASTLGHAAGFVNGIYLPLFLGAAVTYLDDWEPGTALDVIDSEQISYTAAMPTHLLDLLHHDSLATRDIASLRTVRVSGGPISRRTLLKIQRSMPQTRLCPGWGMTECLYLTSSSPDDDTELRMSSDGHAFDNVKVEARDVSLTRAVPDGQIGALVVRTSSKSLGYLGREDLTAEALTSDGWFRTGDVGRVDDGVVTIVGREKEIVIRGGENIPAVAVEQLVEEHPKTRRAAVIGVPDERLGERACAVVECHDNGDPLTFDELSEFLIARGATKQFIPEHLLTVEALPLTPTGKVRKGDLADMYTAMTSAPEPRTQPNGAGPQGVQRG